MTLSFAVIFMVYKMRQSNVSIKNCNGSTSVNAMETVEIAMATLMSYFISLIKNVSFSLGHGLGG